MTMPIAQPRSTLSTTLPTASTPNDHLQDIPVRSRNARAQARHRAKRKAYIEQLEDNVAKLQAILGLTPEQVQALPAATTITNKLQDLENENIRLRRELDLWRPSHSQLPPFVHPHPPHDRWSPDDSNSDRSSHHSIHQHPVPLSPHDPLLGPPFAKKRKVSSDDSTCSPVNYSVLGVVAAPAPNGASNGLASRAPLQVPGRLSTIAKSPLQHQHQHQPQPQLPDGYQYSNNPAYHIKTEPQYDTQLLTPATPHLDTHVFNAQQRPSPPESLHNGRVVYPSQYGLRVDPGTDYMRPNSYSGDSLTAGYQNDHSTLDQGQQQNDHHRTHSELHSVVHGTGTNAGYSRPTQQQSSPGHAFHHPTIQPPSQQHYAPLTPNSAADHFASIAPFY